MPGWRVGNVITSRIGMRKLRILFIPDTILKFNRRSYSAVNWISLAFAVNPWQQIMAPSVSQAPAGYLVGQSGLIRMEQG